jgi:LysR family hydrogen peroxide-inducible transcriptional activator
MNRIPTIKQLRYLSAVAEYRSFRRAADACFISQPALSEQIAQLESLLEVQLVERSQRRVMLTPLGEAFVRKANRILRDLEDLVELALQSKELFSTPIRMGVIPTIAPYLLPRILRRVRRVYPRLKLYLREEQTARLLRQLQEGKLEVLLLALPVTEGEFISMPLYDEEFVLVSSGQKKFPTDRALRQKDISGEQVLLLEEGHCLREQALEVCNMAGARESQEFRASSLNTLVQMVANGMGITLLPRLAVDVEVRRSSNLKTIPFSEPVPVRQVGLVWRKQSARQEEFRLLYEVFLNNLPAEVQMIQTVSGQTDSEAGSLRSRG